MRMRSPDVAELIDKIAQCLPMHAPTILRKDEGDRISIRSTPTPAVMSLDGRLAYAHELPDGRKIILEFYGPEELFAFVDVTARSNLWLEPIDKTVRVLSWTPDQMKAAMTKHKDLSNWLGEWMMYRHSNLATLVIDCLGYSIEKRVKHALQRLCYQFGEELSDGKGVQLPPFTHEVIAQHIGTSREVISHHFNMLRKRRQLSYDRNGIIVKFNFEDVFSGNA